MALNTKFSLGVLTTAMLYNISLYAADKELLDMLLQNGAITQTQYDTLITKETISKQDVEDIRIKLDQKGLQFETADKEFQFAFGGRIQADSTWQSHDKLIKNGTPIEANDGTEIRRGRIAFKGVMWRDWKFMTEVDFADNDVAIKDMFLTYTGLEHFEFTAGNQKQPISMELQESSNDIMFTERSLVNSLTGPLFDRAIGFHAKSSGNNWSAQLGAYGDTISPNKNPNMADEGWGIASRLTWAPIDEKTKLIHLGAYGGYRGSNGNGQIMDHTLRFRYETTHMSNLYLTDTGSITDVDGASLAGAELAGMYGPFSVQFEYAHTWVDRSNDLATLDFNAWYVQTAWTITGESRTYKGSDGEFKRLKPNKNFSLREGGGWGAWELATRFDGNDLNSHDILGGSETAITIALNWYVNQNVRFMADYRRPLDITNSPVTQPNGSQPDNVDSFTFRTQLAF